MFSIFQKHNLYKYKLHDKTISYDYKLDHFPILCAPITKRPFKKFENRICQMISGQHDHIDPK